MTDNIKRSRKFLYISACIGNLVAFSAGIMLGWTSSVTVKLTNETRIDENPFGAVISTEQESWIVSTFMLGASVCPIIAAILTNKIGRKKTLLCCSGVPLLVAYLVLAFGKNIFLYYTARFIGGFSSGTVLSVLPSFLSEISEDAIRGRVASSMSVSMMAGTLYAYAVGPYLSIMWFNLTCAIWPALFLVLFFPIVPESPYHFIAFGDISGAIQSLKKFRSASETSIMAELKVIRCFTERETEKSDSLTAVFKSKAFIKALIIVLSLAAFEVFCGISVVWFNAQSIFGSTEAHISPEISTIILGFVQVCATCIAPLAVDRLGRKILLLISATGMFIVEVPLGFYFYLYDSGKEVSNISWLPIVCITTYIVFFTFGFGAVPWIVLAEVFPTNIKAFATTLMVCFNAFLGFVLLKSFPSLVAAIGMGGTFWLFAVFCAAAVPFLLFYMIETKGKSFEEIQNILSK